MKKVRRMVVAGAVALGALGAAAPADATLIYSGGCIDWGGGGCRVYQWCNWNTSTRSGECVTSNGGHVRFSTPNIAYDVS